MLLFLLFSVFFFNDTATTEIYTLSLHDALPIYESTGSIAAKEFGQFHCFVNSNRSEEHTSELQSPTNLVCRLLLEKKKKIFFFFFFNDTATTEIYTLSLHDALPIYESTGSIAAKEFGQFHCFVNSNRSEEHTSELQSPTNLVCRLLLEKKKVVAHRVRLRKLPRTPHLCTVPVRFE